MAPPARLRALKSHLSTTSSPVAEARKPGVRHRLLPSPPAAQLCLLPTLAVPSQRQAAASVSSRRSRSSTRPSRASARLRSCPRSHASSSSTCRWACHQAPALPPPSSTLSHPLFSLSARHVDPHPTQRCRGVAKFLTLMRSALPELQRRSCWRGGQGPDRP